MQYLESSLQEKGLLAGKSQDALTININIDYRRNFNYGGKSLNKPKVSHQVVVTDKGTTLASFGSQNYTTKYSYFQDAAVNLEISAFSWDQEDEPKDVELISNLIIENLANLGS